MKKRDDRHDRAILKRGLQKEESGSDSSSDSSAEQPDTTAPVITYADGKKDSYTMVSGEKVTLPSATAADEKDGAVDVDVSVTSKGASIVKTEAGYEFSSTTAGT